MDSAGNLYIADFGNNGLRKVTSAGPAAPPQASNNQLPAGGIAATVSFAGLVSPGLYQFKIVVSSAAPDGENTLTGTYSSLSTQASVVITV